MDVQIRQATIDDLPEITALFRNTILNINSKDYSEKQILVWASGANNTKKWLERINKHYFLVAEFQDQIVGFAYLKDGNYLDGLFVHAEFQGRGIASKLLTIMESKVISENYDSMESDVSITSLPFFENHYYEVIKKQRKQLRGVNFDNFIIRKIL